MTLSRWRSLSITLATLCLVLLLLVACGGNTQKAQTAPRPTPSPSPTPTQGQQILALTAHTLNSAKTLRGIFNLTITGQTINGTLKTEIWNVAPAKNRTEVHQSTISQVPSGTVTVTDGKTIWQYNPVKNVVYSGPAQSANNGTGSFSDNGQGQFVVTLVQNVFTHSDGTLKSSTATVNGHAVYDVGVVPQSDAATATGPGNFSYSGDVYVDRGTQLPVRVNLNIQGLGTVLLDLPQLTLNRPISDSTFTFATPAGAKELPLQQATQTADLISLTQAQQQAGFHLLSISGDQVDYTLQGVNILGAPGSHIYTLHYMKGSTNFTIAQGKPLANLSASNSQRISLRGTTAFLSSQNGNNILTWTEKGVGINITGPLSNDQLVTIAKALI